MVEGATSIRVAVGLTFNHMRNLRLQQDIALDIIVINCVLPFNYTAVPLDEIRVDDKLNFMEEPVEISEREFKKLKRSRIAIVNVRWNSKRGPEFTWEHED
ncbi:hypothetical protein Tco_1056544 [Tanacetum coccineum]|uniref:Reverse transcriptase domain-containing protein n=1 Tax=Tanacetum coccineum TaxID=301880 RepID=A0ABQ5H2V2_9ASTR